MFHFIQIIYLFYDVLMLRMVFLHKGRMRSQFRYLRVYLARRLLGRLADFTYPVLAHRLGDFIEYQS